VYARASEFRGPPEQLEEGVRYTRAAVLPQFKGIPGYCGAISLVDWHNGRALTLTLWETEAAMRASEEEASELRSSVAEHIGERVAGVDRFEITLFDVR